MTIHRADEGAKAMRPEETMTTHARRRLRCQALHPDMHTIGADIRCGGLLGYLPTGIEFIGAADRLPIVPELGDIWVRCTNRRCGRWNRFRIARAEAA